MLLAAGGSAEAVSGHEREVDDGDQEVAEPRHRGITEHRGAYVWDTGPVPRGQLDQGYQLNERERRRHGDGKTAPNLHGVKNRRVERGKREPGNEPERPRAVLGRDGRFGWEMLRGDGSSSLLTIGQYTATVAWC